MVDTKKVCLLITSQKCGHCIKMRNSDGKLLPFSKEKGVYNMHPYDYEFVKNIITVNNKYSEHEWTFINVHFLENYNISSISIFKLKSNYIKQVIYEPYVINNETITFKEVHSVNKNQKINALSKEKKIVYKTWKETIKTYIPNPETIGMGYVRYLPIFIYYLDKNRIKCIDKEGVQENFYARGVGNIVTTNKKPYHFTVDKNMPSDPLISLSHYDDNIHELSPDIKTIIVPKYKNSHNYKQR